MKYFIALRSDTVAERTVKILEGLNIHAKKGRRSDKRGCFAGVYINEFPEKICRILSENNISCIYTAKVGEGR